jgi:hypothetical protein
VDSHEIPNLCLDHKELLRSASKEPTHGMGRWKVRVELPRSQQGVPA